MGTTRKHSPTRTATCIAAFTLSVLASGCAQVPSLGEGLSNMGAKALETIGYKKPELPTSPDLPEAAKPGRTLKLRIAASESLNVDDEGKSLSLLVRVYKLRSPSAFLNAPQETFGNAAKEKELLADELIESRELVLLPGQQQNINERWAREASYVGVVALYRTPAAQLWRHAFELEQLPVGNGIVLGAHACGLSIASGSPTGQTGATSRKSAVDCPVRRTTAATQTTQQEGKGKS